MNWRKVLTVVAWNQGEIWQKEEEMEDRMIPLLRSKLDKELIQELFMDERDDLYEEDPQNNESAEDAKDILAGPKYAANPTVSYVPHIDPSIGTPHDWKNAYYRVLEEFLHGGDA